MFLELFQGLMIPAIIMNVLNATAFMNRVTCPSMLVKAVIYCFITSLMSVTTGIILCLVIPLDGGMPGESVVSHPIDIIYSMANNMCRRRVIGLFIGTVKFDLSMTEMIIDGNVTNSTSSMIVVKKNFNFNVLGLIALCFVYGVVMRKYDDKVRAQRPADRFPYLRSFSRITESIMFYTHVFIMPVAVVCFAVKMLADTHDWSLMLNLAKFIGIIICGLLAHGVILLPLLYLITVWKNPLPLIEHFYDDVLCSTLQCNTSTTTLELCLELCRDAGIDQDVSRLILPIGHKVNLNGTALYEAMAVIFVARLQNVTLDPLQLAVLGLMVVMVSIGVGGLHSRGAIVTVFVLKAFGLQYDNLIGLLAFVEILLYPLCEAVNAAGNCFGAAIIHYGNYPEQNTPDGSPIIA
uniref:Amino acid transporter n=1 Tax=Neogobius melanostomus TaxID=47308 RepID=A0A8C6SXI6_9GOBI